MMFDLISPNCTKSSVMTDMKKLELLSTVGATDSTALEWSVHKSVQTHPRWNDRARSPKIHVVWLVVLSPTKNAPTIILNLLEKEYHKQKGSPFSNKSDQQLGSPCRSDNRMGKLKRFKPPATEVQNMFLVFLVVKASGIRRSCMNMCTHLRTWRHASQRGKELGVGKELGLTLPCPLLSNDCESQYFHSLNFSPKLCHIQCLQWAFGPYLYAAFLTKRAIDHCGCTMHWVRPAGSSGLEAIRRPTANLQLRSWRTLMMILRLTPGIFTPSA